MAALETVKRDFPFRQLLEGKSLTARDMRRISVYRSRRPTEQHAMQSVLTKSMELKEIDQQLNAFITAEKVDRRKKAIKDVISEAFECFEHSIQNLDLSPEAN